MNTSDAGGMRECLEHGSAGHVTTSIRRVNADRQRGKFPYWRVSRDTTPASGNMPWLLVRQTCSLRGVTPFVQRRDRLSVIGLISQMEQWSLLSARERRTCSSWGPRRVRCQDGSRFNLRAVVKQVQTIVLLMREDEVAPYDNRSAGLSSGA